MALVISLGATTSAPDAPDNLYTTLGLTSKATASEIQKAYHALAKQYQ